MKLKTRTCKDCLVTYPRNFFSLVSTSYNLDINGQPYRRRRCNAQGNSCYHNHKRNLKGSKREKGLAVRNYKMNLSCKLCGYSKETKNTFSPHGLEFHHPRKNKEANVSDMIADGFSLKKIFAEMKKCIVLCSLCHIELHDINHREDEK
mgnify:CR=1 FL=1